MDIMGRDCTYCNVGPNTGFYGFDWESAGVNGAKAFTAELMRRAQCWFKN